MDTARGMVISCFGAGGVNINTAVASRNMLRVAERINSFDNSSLESVVGAFFLFYNSVYPTSLARTI